MRSKSLSFYRNCLLTVLILSAAIAGLPQMAKQTQGYPSHLPYAFSNFVWWNDEELRIQLKKRMPALGEEIAPDSDTLRKMRDTLKEMLKEKGIQADVQTEEPSSFALTAQRAPGAPPPAIVFSILNPQILVGKILIAPAPEGLTAALQNSLQAREGHEYSSRQDWLVHSNIIQELESNGYLEAEVDIAHDTPRKDGSRYLVNLLISVKPGPQYHIASITADGGPLLQGQDLSRFFTQKRGDIANDNQFGPLPVQLRAYYEQRGYADVQIKAPPILDRGNGLVSYHLEVTPGPVYHLHSLTIHNLDPDSEKKARELLGLNVGDLYDGMAVDLFYRKISADAALAAYGLTFSPAKNKATAAVDLTLDFYKVDDKSSVTVK
jgi:hypothetical protein